MDHEHHARFQRPRVVCISPLIATHKQYPACLCFATSMQKHSFSKCALRFSSLEHCYSMQTLQIQTFKHGVLKRARPLEVRKCLANSWANPAVRGRPGPVHEHCVILCCCRRSDGEGCLCWCNFLFMMSRCLSHNMRLVGLGWLWVAYYEHQLLQGPEVRGPSTYPLLLHFASFCGSLWWSRRGWARNLPFRATRFLHQLCHALPTPRARPWLRTIAEMEAPTV